MLRDLLFDIGQNYLTETTKELTANAFAERVRKHGQQTLFEAVGDNNLKYKTSVGQGNWAAVPWLGIFNPESTTSATHGIYVVYLFDADFKSAYLCLGQGVTKVKEEFGKGQIEELKRRAELIRARVPEHKRHFVSGGVNLGGSTNLAKEYDSAVAFYKEYNLEKLPENGYLESDLKLAVQLYELLIARGGTDNLESVELSNDSNDKNHATIIEKRQYIRHMKIERNAKAAKLAKKVHGYTCQGCGVNFQNIYGNIGKEYIEAHHLRPLHTLAEGESIAMDIVEDFAVLCANCHKIVHRAQPILTIQELRKIDGVRMLRKAFENKYGKNS